MFPFERAFCLLSHINQAVAPGNYNPDNKNRELREAYLSHGSPPTEAHRNGDGHSEYHGLTGSHTACGPVFPDEYAGIPLHGHRISRPRDAVPVDELVFRDILEVLDVNPSNLTCNLAMRDGSTRVVTMAEYRRAVWMTGPCWRGA